MLLVMEGDIMGASNFDQATISGKNAAFQQAVDALRKRFRFDFVSMGITAFPGAPLTWLYSAGETSNRHRRISLAPGHGIGGIVLKTGKPMLFTDIDSEMDPREYSSYPIVFAEDLRSFCALPLKRADHVIAVLLCAFRNVDPSHAKTFRALIADELRGVFCGLEVVSEGFIGLGETSDRSEATLVDISGDTSFAGVRDTDETGAPKLLRGDLARAIGAQEEERRRISRELHDGVAQELLTVTFTLQRLTDHVDAEGADILEEARGGINGVLDELHNISVMLRPSSLDHLGFVPALRSQALLLEKTYGSAIRFEGQLSLPRFDRALETQAYRICQEAMTNACKYSGSDVVTVSVETAGNWLHISIVDEGCGFDVAHPAIKGTGCGLLGMQERANQVGATLSVESNEHGTRVTLVTPMRSSEEGDTR